MLASFLALGSSVHCIMVGHNFHDELFVDYPLWRREVGVKIVNVLAHIVYIFTTSRAMILKLKLLEKILRSRRDTNVQGVQREYREISTTKVDDSLRGIHRGRALGPYDIRMVIEGEI